MSVVFGLIYAERIALLALVVSMAGGFGVACAVVYAIGGWR